MEDKKKFSNFDMVNILVLAVGLILAVITVIQYISGIKSEDSDIAVVAIIGNIAMLVGYIAALIYMVCKYTKQVAYLYKVFMYSFVVRVILSALISMKYGSGTLWGSLLILAIVLLSMGLATAKDLGKNKTFIIAGMLLSMHILELIKVISLGAMSIMMIPNLLFTIEACIMVLAKYSDKDARGAK